MVPFRKGRSWILLVGPALNSIGDRRGREPRAFGTVGVQSQHPVPVAQVTPRVLGEGVRLRRLLVACSAALLAGCSPGPLAAQKHAPVAGPAEGLGTVHFPTSCGRNVAPEFDRAVALLHSFEFGDAIKAFNAVLASDSSCAMAYWGIALSRWTNPMAPGGRPLATLQFGRQAAGEATRLARNATERERGYIGAVSELFDDYEHVPQPMRVAAYERAMASLSAAEPADTEAKIFHALALVSAAPPTDKTYANQLKAGAELEAVWAKQPNHPGLAHYIIHSYDVPALAPRAAAAAERYARIAPSSAHALHMPSHTFTRVGKWQESVTTNLRSLAAALKESAMAEALHASDYAVYAYLQMRHDAAAQAVVAGLPALAANFDPTAVTGAAPGSAGVFALAAIPARYALERRAWTEAAALQPKASAFLYPEAVTFFARALGASHLADTALARASIDSLAAIRDRLLARGEAYWGEQVAIQYLEASAWLELAEGQGDAAVARMREAAVREDATEKSAVTPGPLAPARELLGDMLLERKRPAEALEEYRRTMTKEPGRFRSLYGAMRAAGAAGDRAMRAKYGAELKRLTGSAAFRGGGHGARASDHG